MKEIVNSLDGVFIQTGRRVGNTTRIADNAIKLLFSGKKVIVHDHAHKARLAHPNNYLMDMIRSRLKFEHNIDRNNFLEVEATNDGFYHLWFKDFDEKLKHIVK